MSHIHSILFVHRSERRFEIQSAEQASLGRRLGYVVLRDQVSGERIWYCQSEDGSPLLIQDGRLKVFGGAWDAVEWLVQWYNCKAGGVEIQSLTERAGS